MILQHIFPVFALLLMGIILKRAGLTSRSFLNTADRLIYYIFFPLLLFWKIGAAPQNFPPQAWRFYLAAFAAVACLYLLSLACIVVFKIPAFQAGSFSQSCYRFNTYVGVAVILSVMGEKGVAHFGILIGMVIPFINVLAVTTLIWYAGHPGRWPDRLRITAKSIVTNPLILGCAAGLIYARWVNVFPVYIENTLRLGASVTLPLALLSIGGSLTVKTVKQHIKLALVASTLKLVVLPLLGLLLMRRLGVEQPYIGIGMIFFALPTSTAIYVLSSQLNSDTEFASAAIALSTGLSFLSLSAVLWWLHA